MKVSKITMTNSEPPSDAIDQNRVDDNSDELEVSEKRSPERKQMKNEEANDLIEVDEFVLRKVIKAKITLAEKKYKRRLLLEELHRQCLEGEIDPRKRLKGGSLPIGKKQE